MAGDTGSGSSMAADEWGSAVASGDATKLAVLVLLWAASKPERALSILKDCVSVLEREVVVSVPASSPLQLPPTTPDEWGTAVANSDATKLAELVLAWSGSKPERALSVLRNCVSLMEKEVEFSTPACRLPSLPTTPGGSSRNLQPMFSSSSIYTSSRAWLLTGKSFLRDDTDRE
ncbi:unnamed protein product [Ectocarpus fasciculatus]